MAKKKAKRLLDDNDIISHLFGPSTSDTFPTFGQDPASIGLGRHIQQGEDPINKAPSINIDQGNAGTQVTVQNPKVNGFTADTIAGTDIAYPSSLNTSPLHTEIQSPAMKPVGNAMAPNLNVGTGSYAQSAPDSTVSTQTGPNPAAPPLTGFAKDLSDYQAKLAEPAHKQGIATQIGFQLAQAAQNFSRGYYGQPMMEQQWLGNVKKNIRDDQARKQFAPKLEAHQFEVQAQTDKLKQATEYGKTQAELAKAVQEQIKAGQQINPLLGKQIEELLKSGAPVSPELAAAAKAAGYGAIAPGIDTRQMETMERNGQTFQRRKGSDDEWQQVSSAPADLTKLPVQRSLPDTGQSYYTTGSDAARTLAQGQINQVRMNSQVEDKNLALSGEDDNKTTAWQTKEDKRGQDVVRLANEAVALVNQQKDAERRLSELTADRDRMDTEEGKREADSLRKEIVEKQTQADSKFKEGDYLAKHPTPKPKTGARKKAAPTLSTNTPPDANSQIIEVTMDDVAEYAKKKGISLSEARSRFEAKKNIRIK